MITEEAKKTTASVRAYTFGAREENHFQTELFPSIAMQLRYQLHSFHLAFSRLIPIEERENNFELDQRAAAVDRSFYQMLRLVNNLSLSACMNDPDSLRIYDTDLVKLVSESCEYAGSLAYDMGVTLRFRCAMDQHICAVAPDAMNQVMGHLLSNALKFTPKGGEITVELKRSQQQIELTVKDTGVGMTDEQLSMVFNRYAHTEQLAPPPYGLGLGLALCQQVIQLQGGTMVATSAPGAGSCFTVRLPNKSIGVMAERDKWDYTGGFNPTLLLLADALPSEAFLLRNR